MRLFGYLLRVNGPCTLQAALPNSEAIAQYLVEELKEMPALRQKFKNAAEALGADVSMT
jgi:hypothetical protein